jgi:hypothetical protein
MSDVIKKGGEPTWVRILPEYHSYAYGILVVNGNLRRRESTSADVAH